jgi:hypothetical protein
LSSQREGKKWLIFRQHMSMREVGNNKALKLLTLKMIQWDAKNLNPALI